MPETKTTDAERIAELEREIERLKSAAGGPQMMIAVETATGGGTDDVWVVRAGERRPADDPLLDNPAAAQFFRPETEVSPDQLRAEQTRRHVQAVAESRAEARRQEERQREQLRKDAEEKERRGEEWGRQWERRWLGQDGREGAIDFARRSS